jgi:hypothetical protein
MQMTIFVVLVSVLDTFFVWVWHNIWLIPSMMLAVALTEKLTGFIKSDFLWTHYLIHFRDPGFNYFRVSEWFSCFGQYMCYSKSVLWYSLISCFWICEKKISCDDKAFNFVQFINMKLYWIFCLFWFMCPVIMLSNLIFCSDKIIWTTLFFFFVFSLLWYYASQI